MLELLVSEGAKYKTLTLRLSPVCLLALFVTMTAAADATSELLDISRDYDVTQAPHSHRFETLTYRRTPDPLAT